MMKLTTLIVLGLLWIGAGRVSGHATAQRLSGRIMDNATGEPLATVTVSVVGTRLSTSSNAVILYGRFIF